jgi:hypothetical protein
MDGRHHPASRVAWILTHGEDIADGLVACHRCDNPACCNPAHLFLGSPLQNNDDKVTKRRHILGEKVNTAKLTEDQVREIKALRPSSGLKCRAGERAAIAKRYGVSAGTINDVWSRNWKHV